MAVVAKHQQEQNAKSFSLRVLRPSFIAVRRWFQGYDSKRVEPKGFCMTATMNSAWIARYLVQHTFQRKALMIVPECYWVGSECDLLLVTQDLRVIDIEIKISRADFKRDKAKDKWYHSWDYSIDGPWIPRDIRNQHSRRKDWPDKVWKHYFAMPYEVWKPEMVEDLPSTACGIILLKQQGDRVWWHVEKMAKPCRDAEKISPQAAIDIARLANLRMWDALIDKHNLQERIKLMEKAA